MFLEKFSEKLADFHLGSLERLAALLSSPVEAARLFTVTNIMTGRLLISYRLCSALKIR